MDLTDPAVIGALSAAAGVALAEGRQWLTGARQSRAQLAEIEQRIAENLLTKLDDRLRHAEQRIAVLERELHQERSDREALQRALAVVTAERDALLLERTDLLNRISILTPPTIP